MFVYSILQCTFYTLCRVPGSCSPRRQGPYGQTAERYFFALKIEGLHLWLSLTSSNPRQSPNATGFNIHSVVQYSYPLVETSVGEALISTRHLAVSKISAWLGSNEYPRRSVSKSSFTVKPLLSGISRYQNIFPLKPGFRLIKAHYI